MVDENSALSEFDKQLIGQLPYNIYDKGGKFEAKQEYEDEAREKADKEGLIYRGDATTGQIISEFVRNAPDATYSFLARGAEGLSELAVGLALSTYKGGQLATHITDPEKLKEIMAEPAFTKYMGEFRGKLGSLNLGENTISGPTPEEIAGTTGYYTAPVPVGTAALAVKTVAPIIAKHAPRTVDYIASGGAQPFKVSAGGKKVKLNQNLITQEFADEYNKVYSGLKSNIPFYVRKLKDKHGKKFNLLENEAIKQGLIKKRNVGPKGKVFTPEADKFFKKNYKTMTLEDMKSALTKDQETMSKYFYTDYDGNFRQFKTDDLAYRLYPNEVLGLTKGKEVSAKGSVKVKLAEENKKKIFSNYETIINSENFNASNSSNLRLAFSQAVTKNDALSKYGMKGFNPNSKDPGYLRRLNLLMQQYNESKGFGKFDRTKGFEQGRLYNKDEIQQIDRYLKVGTESTDRTSVSNAFKKYLTSNETYKNLNIPKLKDEFYPVIDGRIKKDFTTKLKRYLDFVRQTSPSTKDPVKGDFSAFMKKFKLDIEDLQNPNSTAYQDFKNFTYHDKVREEVGILVKDFLNKRFLASKNRPDGTIRTEAERISEAKNSIQIAHTFEGSQVGKTVGEGLEGAGMIRGSYYLDMSELNAIRQPLLESEARSALKIFKETGDRSALNAVDQKLTNIGSEITVGEFTLGTHKPLETKLFELLGGPPGSMERKILQQKYGITDKEISGVERAIKLLNQSSRTIGVSFMKDGGIVQYFKDGTDQEGVTADQGPISGIDVKPYIPPHLRMSEDKLTVGDIGTGISEAAETMWPYMVPGVGEYLSAKDYEMFSQQAEEAWGKGEYPSWLGATILGSVALGGTVPNWTVVGAVPNLALGAYKGIKKAITPTPTKIAKKPIVEMEKRYVIKDEAGNKVFQAKSIDDAEQKVLVLKDKEGKNFTIEEINIPKKVKKTKQEVVHVPTVEATDVIGSGNNRLFYSKMDQYMQGTNGNIRVKIGGSGSSVDIPINEAKLSAKEWHDSFRAAGVKESELVDSYIRQYLNKKGVFKDGKFTNNQPIAYAEIKELFDGSPSRFVQSSKYSDADGNLKYGDGGRSKGYKDGTREEHVLWMDSKDIRGDVQELPSNIARYEGHRDIRKVETDANFSTNNKLEGEPYVIGWSLVDDRPGILANKKNVTVTTATEIQSDFLQKAASLKANLKKDLKTNIQAGNTSTVKEITQKLENIFRQMPLTSAEIKGYTSQIEQASKVFDDVAKMDLNLVDDAVMRQLDEAAALRDEALAGLNKFIDDIDPKDLFPNIPFKDQKDWVSSLIKNDVAIAAQKRFYFDENGVLQVNKNAPSHYSVAPSVTQKNRWMQSSMRDNPDIGMNTPPNMRSTREHGQAVAYDLEYGGPNVYAPDTWQVVDESKIIKDIDGKIVRYEDGYVVSKGHPRIVSAEGVLNKMVDDGLSIENIKIEKVKTHFTSNSEATLRKIASEKNAEFSIGKVKHGNEMVESYLIELTPEMLTPFAQYFKHGGLVEKIPQYNPLQSVLDVLGPIGAY